MIRISGIYTIRDTPQPSYWDIIFEWEDQLSLSLGVPLVPVGKKYDQIYSPSFYKKILNRLNLYQFRDTMLYPRKHYLAFHIGPPGVYSFYTRNNVIPIIIDFWKSEDVKRFESIFKLSPAVFVTSKQVYNYLAELKLKIKLRHLALSLPDKYFSFSKKTEARDVDIIQIGRSNAMLDEYMFQFIEDFPETHYVCAKKVDGQILILSNKLGEMGEFKERANFVGLLKRSKISLVSAPGLDNDRKRTGGFSPVTPRFFESAASGCKLIGVYPENDDFDYYRIPEICSNVTSYEQFKSIAVEYLSDSNPSDFSDFLKYHLTSKRAVELLNKLRNGDK